MEVSGYKLRMIFYGYTFMIGMWSIMLFTWYMAFFHGGEITVSVNFYGEAMFEFVYNLIITVFILMGYYLLFKILKLEKAINLKRRKTLKQLIFEIKLKYYVLYLSIGAISGMGIAEIFVAFSNRARFFIGSIHIHHLYIGILGAFILTMYYIVREKVTKRTNLLIVLCIGVFVGIALHDIFYVIIEGRFNVFFTLEDLFSLTPVHQIQDLLFW